MVELHKPDKVLKLLVVMYMYIIHYYVKLKCMYFCILHCLFSCLKRTWFIIADLDFKKTHCCLRQIIQYLSFIFGCWGGGGDFVFNHVTFIGCFFSNIIQLLFTLPYYCINVILLVYILCWVLLIWLYTVHISFSKNKFRKNKQLKISCIFSYDCYL